MDDLREKVIKGLEMHASGMCNVVTSSNGREYCPYWENNDNCMVSLLKDALSLLKAQEPIEPIKHLSTGQICGSCKKVLLRKYKYCPACGKEVKWDD